MKVIYSFGTYGAALAVLFLFSNTHHVLSSSIALHPNDNDDISNSIIQIEAEIMRLTIEEKEKSEKFDKRILNINNKAKQDLSDADFMKCNHTDKACLSVYTKKLLKAEAKLQKLIKRVKGNRIKYLSEFKESVKTKKQEINDLRLRRSATTNTLTVLSHNVVMSNDIDPLVLLNESIHMDADCAIYGLTADLSESEWDELIDAFQAIVNLGYVFTGKDRIYLDVDIDNALPNRNLRKRRRFFRGITGTCRGCRPKDPYEDILLSGYVDPFVTFVNEHLAGVIVSIVPPDQIAPDTLIQVSCNFSG
jgi:hypothetical protein